MFASAWRGSRWCACALGVAALFAAVLMIAPATGGAGSRTAAAAKKCTKAIVNGRHACLRKGDKCKKAYQADYVDVGLSCKHKRLRKASIKELRGSQPLLLSDNGYLSLKTALAAFDSQIADLPGVKPKPGEVGNVTEATYVVDRIAADLDKLTPKQRAVYEQWTTPGPDALVIDPDNPRPSLAHARRAPATPQELILADTYMDNAIRVLKNHGYLPAKRITLTLLPDQGTGKPTDLGYVPPSDLAPGTSPTCNVFLTLRGRGMSEVDKQFVLAHEAVHCMQHAYYTGQADQAAVPAWVKEGTADYLGAKVMLELNAGTPTQVAWTKWLTNPQKDLFGRSYDGLGFFAMLDQAGVDTWSRIKNVIAAGVSGKSDGAYAAALAGVPDIFYMRWGPGIMRDAALGPEWDYTGPYIDSSRPSSVNISSGGAPKTSKIDAHAGTAATLKIGADVVTIKADKDIRGLLRFGGTQTPLKKGAYCAKPGGCKCRTHTNLQLPAIGKTTYLGYGDSKKARVVSIQGRSLKDYCEHPTPGPAGPGDGGGSCPTTPTARPPARRECPAPSAGIMILDDPESTTPVANFTIGSCTQGPGGFTAIAEDGAWHLEVGITNFTGYGSYEIPYGGPDPEVVIDGPGGTRGNVLWQPGGLPFSGAIDFGGDPHHMGLGFIEYRDAAGSEASAITGAGGMTCVYPEDE